MTSIVKIRFRTMFEFVKVMYKIRLFSFFWTRFIYRFRYKAETILKMLFLYRVAQKKLGHSISLQIFWKLH